MLLEVENISIAFKEQALIPVWEANFKLAPGQLIGVAGESGSGKTLTALSIMGLLPPGAYLRSGKIIFQGRDLASLKGEERRKIMGRDIGFVFQEPLTALNPVLTIGDQLSEIFRYRLGKSKKEALLLSGELLEKVSLPINLLNSYPHRLSGGMRQRVVIAQALALSPSLLIADEPTTALDPTIAMQIIELIKNLVHENKSAAIFITHNLRLLRFLTSRILVMYAGMVLEEADTELIFSKPFHPYTKGLLKSLPPALSETPPQRLSTIKGNLNLFDDPERKLCPFLKRCPEAMDICYLKAPALLPKSNGGLARCFLESHA